MLIGAYRSRLHDKERQRQAEEKSREAEEAAAAAAKEAKEKAAAATTKHDGLSEVAYGSDSKYVPALLSAEEARKCYESLCEEAFFDPATAAVRQEMEIQDVVWIEPLPPDKTGKAKGHRVAEKGVAILSENTTFLHPREGSYSEFYGRWMMPHRHTHFGIHNLDLSARFQNNSTRKFVKGLDPLFPFSQSPTVDLIRQKVEEHLGLQAGFINYCNMNVYAKGDHLGLHQDPNTNDGTGHVVRTVTLGASRKYEVVHDVSKQHTQINVQPGPLNILGCDTNENHRHQMNKTVAKGVAPRISLNFRHLELSAGASVTAEDVATVNKMFLFVYPSPIFILLAIESSSIDSIFSEINLYIACV